MPDAVGIEKTPGVVGGEARLARTRIPVWTLVAFQRAGLSDEQILENFPTISRLDLNSAWSYASLHEAEIERAIAENEYEGYGD